MGLDMYAYSAGRARQRDEYWEAGNYHGDGEFISPVTKPKEIAYWRKHPNLHGWMEHLWRTKKYPVQLTDANVSVDPDSDTFNGVEIELTWEDLDQLEQDVLEGDLPETRGFFFGDSADDYYRDQDLEFIQKARAELFMGLKVFYNSSW